MSTPEQQDAASVLLHPRAGRTPHLPDTRNASVRLADSRLILQQILNPNAPPRRLLPLLAGLLGAAWLRRRVWQPFLGSELPPWRRAAGLLLALWPTTGQRKRARLARLANNPRTRP